MADATQTIVNQVGYNPEVAPYLKENMAQARALTYNYKQTPSLDAAGKPIIGPDGQPVLKNLLGADGLPVIESFKDPERYGGQVPVLDAAGKPVIGADGQPVTRFQGYERQAGFSDLQKEAIQGAKDMAKPKYDAAGKIIPTANEDAQAIMKKAAQDAAGASYTGSTYASQYKQPNTLRYSANSYLGASAGSAKDATADKYGGAGAGLADLAKSQGYTADKYGGASAGDAAQASVDGYAADTYGGASAGDARDATSEGYTATAADRIGASAARLDAAPTAKAQTTGYAPTLEKYQMGGPERVNTRSFTDQGTADSYMSPYMQNVVDIQQREAQRQADIAGTQQQAAATQAGGFGGSRDSIMRAEAARNLATQKGDIQAQGLQAAYQQAQQQFNAEQGYGLQGQIANQQAGLTAGQQNLGANLGVQQLGTQTGLQVALANLGNQQQTELANQALKGQYGLSQGQMSQQANMQTSSQAQQAALQDAAAKNQASQFTKAAANQAQLANAQEANRMAQYNASNQQQAGLASAAANTQANRSYSDAYNQAQVTNAAAANQMAQYNAGNLQQAGMQNAALGSQASQFGSAAANQAALANSAAANQMAQYNAGNQQQAGMQNAALSTQVQLANKAAANQMAQYNASNLQQAGLAGAAAENQADQFNINQSVASAGLAAQYGQAANQLNEQSKQFGANFGLQGDQAAMQGATGMSNIAGQVYNQNMQTNQLLAGYGSTQQQQEQQRLNTQYQDFLNQQNDPYKKIGFMMNQASAAPTANLGSTMYQAAPSTLNTLVGAGSVLGAAAIKSATGGMVGRYAKGGLVRSRPQGLVALAIHSMA